MITEPVFDIDSLKSFIKDNPVYLFGAGNKGKRWLMLLEEYGLGDRVLGVIDNDKSKWGKVIRRIDGYMRTVDEIDQRHPDGQMQVCTCDHDEIVPDHHAHNDTDAHSVTLHSGTPPHSGCRSYPVISPSDFLKRADPCLVISVSAYHDQIREQLEKMSCEREIPLIDADMVMAETADSSDYDRIIKESDTPLIPKVIHYIWVGGEMPDDIRANIDNWRRMCPDYEFKLWNEKNYDINKNRYTLEAYERGKYGFVGDFMRFDIIYREGGIYLDTDIEMLKKPDELLYQKGFCCMDSTLFVCFGSGFGSAPGNKVIKMLMDDYRERSFVDSDGISDLTTNNILSYVTLKQHGFVPQDRFQRIYDMNIYPMVLQGGVRGIKASNISEKTFWIHREKLSWLDPPNSYII
ncbi:MAG: hypothetical protein K6E33_08820 [Lachnospiraceae bacterium]|nr:hypothetical protein [Lachnospiraceae bacterium]